MSHACLLAAATAVLTLCAPCAPAQAAFALEPDPLGATVPRTRAHRVAEPGPPIAKPRPIGPDGKPLPAPRPRPPKPETPPGYCFPGMDQCPLLPIPYPNTA